ncbi:MAG TPA: acetylxylan esterase [bacterium]|nr:acetylxylan esterase [bacterium]
MAPLLHSISCAVLCMAAGALCISGTDLENIDPEMLFQYQWDLVQKADSARREKLAQIQTVPQWEARKQYVRDTIMEMIGAFPERTPLNARVVGRLDHPDYQVEMVIYESRPNFYVTANLYLPKNHPLPAPAVLFACGHYPEGKAAENYQRCCIGLAKKGYVVLSFDPLGQGERFQHWEIDLHKSPTGATIFEHAKLGNVCILLGFNLANYFIWDGMRSLDYLLSRPEVDPTRIGGAGNSGGGTQTTYIASLDDRVTVAVPDCYITTLKHRIETRQGADDEQNFNPCFQYGIDHFDLLSLRAPKPIQINAAIEDFFPLAGARQTAEDLKNLYGFYNATERVNIAELPGPHAYDKPHREATYAWMNRWLGNEAAGDTEPEIEMYMYSEGLLQCTASGQVVESLGGETVYTLNKAFYRKHGYNRPVPSSSTELDKWLDDLRADVRKLLALPAATGTPRLFRSEPSTTDFGTQTRLVFESEPGIAVPGWLLMPKEHSDVVQIRVFEDGKDAHLNDEYVRKSLENGNVIYLIDPRGMGETMSKRGDPQKYYDYFQEEQNLAYNSFMLGKPLLGGRVWDVLQAVEVAAALPELGRGRITLQGQGSAALLALFAAALDERIQWTACCDMLVSYESLVMNKYFRWHSSCLIPGVLRSFDLPLVAALVAPRKLSLYDTVDEMKQAMPPTTVREIYQPTEAVYRMRGDIRSFNIHGPEM